jgi:hypothetical protein
LSRPTIYFVEVVFGEVLCNRIRHLVIPGLKLLQQGQDVGIEANEPATARR